MKCKILLFRFKSVKWFEYDSGSEIEAECIDFEETFRINKKYSEGLSVSIKSDEIQIWLKSKWHVSYENE